MSILIKKMEMPKGCWACPFAVGKHYECLFTKKSYNWGLTTRPSDCPLIEVQSPHGRLIDADALNNMINRSYPMTDRIDVHNGYAICQEMIKQLPTIIEAEEGEANELV